MPIGTLVNAGAVIVGSIIGLIFHKSFPERFQKIIFQAVGLFTMAIGVMMVLKMKEPMTAVFSLILGGLVGELLRLEARIDGFGEWLKDKAKMKDERFTEGFATAFLIFCVGSMTILGAIEEGVNGEHTLLLTKSLMDGIVSISLAASIGIGVLFSFIPLLAYQLLLTLLAYLFRSLFTPEVIDQLTAVGGVMILGIGFNLLDIKKIYVINLLPALVFIVILTYIVKLFYSF